MIRPRIMGLTVTLAHAPNGDVDGGYWQAPADDAKPRHAVANGLRQAQQFARYYIERNGLGGGNWTGAAGELRLDGELIGRVSYNGRAWRLDGAEMTPADPVLGCYARGAA